MPDLLSPDLLVKMHAYWRAANYLSVGQIYLQDNALLESPLKLERNCPEYPPTPDRRSEGVMGWELGVRVTTGRRLRLT